MEHRALSLGLTVMTLVIVIPSPVVGPVNIQIDEPVEEASAESPGQGLGAADEIVEFGQTQEVEFTVFESEIEGSDGITLSAKNQITATGTTLENLDQTGSISLTAKSETTEGNDGDVTLSGDSSGGTTGDITLGAGTSSGKNELAQTTALTAKSAILNDAYENMIVRATVETGPAEVVSALEGRPIEDSITANGRSSLSFVSNGGLQITTVPADGSPERVFSTDTPVEAIEYNENGDITLAANGAVDVNEGTNPIQSDPSDTDGQITLTAEDGSQSASATNEGRNGDSEKDVILSTVDAENGEVQTSETVTISGTLGEVQLEERADRIFVSAARGDDPKAYLGSVNAENGDFSGLDPAKFRGQSPMQALATACDELTVAEWERAKSQFAGPIQEEFGVPSRTYDRATKSTVCGALAGGGGHRGGGGGVTGGGGGFTGGGLTTG